MKLKTKFVEGQKAKEQFESAMKLLFRASKPKKHEPVKRKKKGKD
jgi:hypothetical protein